VGGLAGGDGGGLVRGAVAHADAEAKAAARQLVHEGGGLRVLRRMARVDVGDAGAECDLFRGDGERLAECKPVAGARAVDSRESFALDSLRELEGRAPSSGDGQEADTRFVGHGPPSRRASILPARSWERGNSRTRSWW